MADEWAVLPGGEEKKDEEEGDDGSVLGGAPNEGADDFHDDGSGDGASPAAAAVSHIDDDGNNSESTFFTWMISWLPFSVVTTAAADSSTHNDEPAPTPQDQDDFQENLDDSNNNNEPTALIQQNVNDSDNDNNELQRQTTIVARPSSQSGKRCLPEDTFSFLIYYPALRSRTFYLATTVFLYQMYVYVLLAYDLFNGSIPVNVDALVRVAEFLAITIAIITHAKGEVSNAIFLLRNGFSVELREKFPGATKAKWSLNIGYRVTLGLLGLYLTLLLIMQSTTVLDLLLNFLAIEFVSQLDDLVFALMKEGFVGCLGREVQEEVEKISNTFYDARPSESRASSFVTRFTFVILFSSMYVFWVYISYRQLSGSHLCSKIFVQYGDEESFYLSTFSGLFYRQNKTFMGRASYYSYRDDQDAGGALLAWCSSETRWTLSLPKEDVGPDDWDPCINWIAASSESEDFDVLTTANAQWVVRARYPYDDVVVAPLSHHFMACYECMNIDNFCGNNGTCYRDGMYDQCKCEEGFYGLRCEYPEPCQTLEINQLGKGFLEEDGVNVASKYYRLEGADTYNRQVYASIGVNQTLSNDTHFIVFTGVRWIMSYKDLFPGLNEVNDKDELIGYFSKKFDARDVTNYRPLFESEPVYTGTQVDATASPLNVQWHKIYSTGLLHKELIASSFLFFCAERCDNRIKDKSWESCYFRGVDICGYCPLPTSPPSETPTSIPSGSGSGN